MKNFYIGLVASLLILSVSVAHAQEGSALDECVKMYQAEGLSLEDAEAKCSSNQTAGEEQALNVTDEQVEPVEPVTSPEPVEPEPLEGISNITRTPDEENVEEPKVYVRDPFEGDVNAPVIIIEYGDFQCSFCQRFWAETLPQIKSEYIDLGLVKFVYRDYPLSSIHPYAQKAAEAAKCAQAQGKFWDYHDRLFSDFSSWQREGNDEFKKIAGELGLDEAGFGDCIDSGRYASDVNLDLEDGIQAGVTGTPTFFVNGIKIDGAQPFPVFQSAIDEQLSMATDDECIKRYINIGYSYGDALKRCTEPVEPVEPVSTPGTVEFDVEDCIRKLQEEGLTQEEAKRICIGPEPSEMIPSATGECIEKYMGAGYTEDEAFKKCIEAVGGVPPDEVLDDVVNECIEKYQREKGLSYEYAKDVCFGDRTRVVSRCAELEEKLFILTQDLTAALVKNDLKMAESLESDIRVVKRELEGCEFQEIEVVEATPVIEAVPEHLAPMVPRGPCAEAEILEDALEQLEKKIIVIKELIEKGEMEKSELEPYRKDHLYLSERLEKTRAACREGSTVEESPCSRLAKLEIVHNEISENIKAAGDEERVSKLIEEITSIRKEIIHLKERCKSVSLVTEEVATLEGLEEAYKAKLKVVVEGAADEDLLAELQSIEDEKMRLIEEFAQRMEELEVKKTSIIKKLRIKTGEVYLDDVKSSATKVKIEVGEKEIEIESKEENLVISDGEVRAEGEIELEYEDGELVSTRTKKKIEVMPGKVGELIKEEIKELKIEDVEGPRYLAKSEKRGRLLAIIPITVAKEYEVSAESGEILKEETPWWGFLVY